MSGLDSPSYPPPSRALTDSSQLRQIGSALCQVELILIAITATALPSRG
jgi:hypothetical protein